MLIVPPHEIDTPWEPQEIAWRYRSRAQRHKAIHDQIALDQTHFVREVWVDDPRTGTKAESLDDAKRALDHTENEFELLRTDGISVVPPEWHVFVDSQGCVRTLARIAIINGMQPKQSVIWPGITAYHQRTDPGPRLMDNWDTIQYVQGVPRALAEVSAGLADIAHIVDMDSRYYGYSF